MIKLLAVDMDGTCLDGKSRMSDKTLKALKAAKDSGILIVPTTGRSLSCLPHRLVNQPDLYRYVITSNGAKVVDCHTNTSVYQAGISENTAVSLLNDCRGQHLSIAAHLEHQYLLQGRIPMLLGRLIYGKDARGVYHVNSMTDTIKNSTSDIEELQFFFLSKNARKNVAEILLNYPELSAAYTKTYVEIYSQNASKGNALTALASSLGIFKEEISCIGDGENDLSMFRASGLKLAMGNAIPMLKEKADHVLPSNDQNGVALGILEYLL